MLPEGASLEGFLWPATYRVLPDTTAEELIRDMLDNFHEAIGDRLDVPTDRGRSFYEILTLASMVEREAVVDEERPTIAGVFENRLHKLRGIAPVLASDPTVFYAADTVNLAKLPFDQWKTYAFWNVPDQPLRDIQLPPELARLPDLHAGRPAAGPDRDADDRLDRRRARRPTRSPATCTSSRRRTARTPTPSRRPRPSTTRTARSTATREPRDGLRRP